MELKIKRVGVVILVALATLGILVSIQFGWKKFFIQNPVISKLDAVSGVKSVQVSSDDTQPEIVINLKAVPNIKQTCRAVLDAAGDEKVQLIDKRTPALSNLLEKSRFVIEEAIAQGDFTTMEKSIADSAKRDKLDSYGVYIDSDYIYLQYQQGSNYLYGVFPRQPGKSQIVTDD